MKLNIVLVKLTAIFLACLSITACDDVQVYGSVGYSSYSGYPGYYGGGYGGGRYGTSVAVGGRIY